MNPKVKLSVRRILTAFGLRLSTVFLSALTMMSWATLGASSDREVEPAGPSSRKTPFAITEIMYRPALPAGETNAGDFEFIEVYNSNPFFEDISGYRLSGAIDFTFPPNTVLQGGEYRVIARDPGRIESIHGISNVMGPMVGTLPQSGTIRLRNKEGAVLLEIDYSNQPPWPAAADGAGHSLVLARPSYGEGESFAWDASDRVGGSPGRYDAAGSSPERAVVINEFLANSEPSAVDFVELYNHSDREVDLTGCSLSDDPSSNKYVMPPGTSIAPRGFLVFNQAQLGFGLNSGGETIYFRDAGGGRVIDAIRFGAQGANVSAGRSPDGAREFYPLANNTPAAANSRIFIHDIVINEIMYKPISTQNDDEYVEIYNQGTNALDLSGWKFISGVDYEIPAGTTLAADGYLVIARNRSRLLTNYPNLNPGNTVGNFSGSLRNQGERLALARPDLNVTTNAQAQVRTNTVYAVVDEVHYGIGGNWGTWANEGGSSLELVDPRSDHRLAHNWADSDESAKAPWTTIEFSGPFDLGYETPDNLQVILLGEGECLLDDVEVFAEGGANLCTNGTFETGMSSWTARGTHLRSTIDNVGFQSGKSMHLRASARGDTSINRLRVPLSGSAPTDGNGTIRARVRWLRGWPEIIVRTHGNWGECFGRMTLPSALGTPGARNSRAASNAPPALFDVRHDPVLPAEGQNIVVTTRCSDPDGIASLNLRYRLDPSTAVMAIPMRDDGTGGDALAGDGIFSGTIPGQPAGTLAAFQIVATDTRDAVRVFPLQDSSYAQPFECLVRVGDPVLAGSFGTYRMWMTRANLDDWQRRPSLSNERIFGTFVYGNFRAIYNMSVKWSGSPYHQYNLIASPEVTEANYSIDLPLDDQMLGTGNFNKLHAPGNGAFEDLTCQREQIAYWTARQMGLPWGYRRFVNVIFNGYRRGGTNAVMEDSQTPGAEMLAQFFPDDPDGNLYKMQLWFESGDVAAGAVPFTPVAGCYLNRYTTVSNGVSVPKVARLRHTFLTRSANGTANEYAPVLDLIDAANSPPGESLTARMTEVADVEEWFRIFAVEHATGNWDSFGAQSAQNMYGYQPTRGKYTLMIWDLNAVFGGTSGAWPPGQNLFYVNASDVAIPALYRHPPFRRMYLRALKEICTGPWEGNPIHDVLDSKYRALREAGIGVAEPGEDGIKAYIAAARTSILATVAGEDAAQFRITTTNLITTGDNLIVVTGEAPVEARVITINGLEYPITWTDPCTFRIQFPATNSINELVLQALDRQGRPLAGFTTNLTVILTRPVSDPAAALVINEIMYHPTNATATYIEIYNQSDSSFDISGWRVNGIGYTFPSISIITNRQYLVLARDRDAFTAAYPGAPIFDLFDGNLDLDGETLTLERPQLAAGTNGPVITTNQFFQVVNKVRYEPAPPWPPLADGFGSSLQLIDATQDNSRPGAWTDREEWRHVTFTGTIAGGTVAGTNFIMLLSAAGETYVDDIVLVSGRQAEAGVNLLVNGDFESPLPGTWTPVGNHAASAIDTQIRHGGNASLHLVAAGPGTPASAVLHAIPRFASNTVCTLSYWFRVDTNAAILGLRASPGNTFISSNPLRPVFYSPGAANTGGDTFPPFDPLWLNEIQPVNTAGITDHFGEHEPWIELYNSGTQAVKLDGYFLADNNASESSPWSFPADTSLAPGAFAIVWLDAQPGQSTATEWHASFRPNPAAGTVSLGRRVRDASQITDYLTYSAMDPDAAYGNSLDGWTFSRQSFVRPTPGMPNDRRDAAVFINEWMAANTVSVIDPMDGDFEDWFEIYNPGTTAVDLGGYWLTDDLATPRQFEIPPNGHYVVPPNGFLVVWADNEPDQNTSTNADLHTSFQLRAAGEAIGLFAPDGITQIDAVTFAQQTTDVSQGRFPDGALPVSFMSTPTPGRRNVIDAPVPSRVGIVVDGTGNVSLSFQTVPGHRYQAEYKSTLDDPVWVPVGQPVPATGNQLTIVDALQAGWQRFFRVLQLD